MESCEIYIKSVRYENAQWTDNPDEMLDALYNNLNEIRKFYFVSVSVNMAQVYNISLKEPNYDSMILYLKGCKYKNTEFLSEELIEELEIELKNKLNFIEGLDYGEIEIRTSKLYTNKMLGLC